MFSFKNLVRSQMSHLDIHKHLVFGKPLQIPLLNLNLLDLKSASPCCIKWIRKCRENDAFDTSYKHLCKYISILYQPSIPHIAESAVTWSYFYVLWIIFLNCGILISVVRMRYDLPYSFYDENMCFSIITA